MKTLISKTFIILALTSPVITVLAATTGFTITNNETIIRNTGLKSPGVDENSSSTLNYVNTETLADTLTTAAGRKGWDGSVKGNSKGITQSGIKRTDAERKGWDGTVKGNSKGINEAGIKRTENHRKGWDGTVKGGNIQDESMNEINNPRSSEQQKANINTSRSNIKNQIRNPADSLQHTGAGDMPAQLQRGIDKKDIRKGMVDNTKTILPLRNDSISQNTDRGVPANRLKTKHDTAKNSVGNIR